MTSWQRGCCVVPRPYDGETSQLGFPRRLAGDAERSRCPVRVHVQAA